MNCRRTRDLLTPYSDGRLTGAQMLDVAHHMDQCPGCRDEYRVIQEVKLLLRAVSRPQPIGSLEREIQKRIATEEAISQINLCLSFSVRPQRAKRIATAMALSCFSVLVVAAPFGAGTLALSYSQKADKESRNEVAQSHRRDLNAIFAGSDVNGFGMFAAASMPMSEPPQYAQDRRMYGQGSGGFMMSQNQKYGTFASQDFNHFRSAPLQFYGHP